VKAAAIFFATTFAAIAGASTPPPVYPRPGECVRQPDGSLLCLPCPDPMPGQPSACVERGVVESVPVDNPLALLLGAGAVALVAARAMRGRK